MIHPMGQVTGVSLAPTMVALMAPAAALLPSGTGAEADPQLPTVCATCNSSLQLLSAKPESRLSRDLLISVLTHPHYHSLVLKKLHTCDKDNFHHWEPGGRSFTLAGASREFPYPGECTDQAAPKRIERLPMSRTA